MQRIGQAYCINLKTRKDRLRQAKRVFKQIDFNPEYHIVDKHPVSGAQGCFESHISVITDAYNKGYERCVIFEDDIVLTTKDKKEIKEALDICLDFITRNNTWEIFYLGVLPDIRYNKSQRVCKGVYKLQGLCTHAYVIHRRLMEKMIGMRYVGVAIDNVYKHLPECYALYPSLFFQGLSTSDLTYKKTTTDLLRCDFTVTLFYRFQEMYAYYIGYPLLDLIMVGICFCIIYFVVYVIYKLKTRCNC